MTLLFLLAGGSRLHDALGDTARAEVSIGDFLRPATRERRAPRGSGLAYAGVTG